MNIEVTLYLSNSYPVTFRAKNRADLVRQLSEYDRRNLIVMLAQALEQLSKRDRQVEALGAMAEKMQ